MPWEALGKCLGSLWEASPPPLLISSVPTTKLTPGPTTKPAPKQTSKTIKPKATQQQQANLENVLHLLWISSWSQPCKHLLSFAGTVTFAHVIFYWFCIGLRFQGVASKIENQQNHRTVSWFAHGTETLISKFFWGTLFQQISCIFCLR